MKATKPNTQQQLGAALLLDCLKEAGVEQIFGYPGGAVLPLYDALYDGLIPHLLMRHEQGAVHAAEGYAKASGKPGVVIVTSGPGATNAVTGIADAMSDSVPLVVITGQVASGNIGTDAFQEADIVNITKPITKKTYQVLDVYDLPNVISDAFHVASSGRKGPVVIDLPKDITTQMTEAEALSPPAASLETILPNPFQINRLLSELEQAKKPLVLVGSGVMASGGEKEFRSFVEKHQLPTLSTLLGLGTLPNDHELFLGMGGMHGTYAANMALMECDLLINIGSRFDDRLASDPENFAPHAKVAHIDIDPKEIGKIIKTHIGIISDAKAALQQLNLGEVRVSCTEWRQLNQRRKVTVPYHYQPSDCEIKPQQVIELVGELTNGEAIVVTDVGQHQMWAAQFYPYKNKNQLITSGGLGTMGYGIPAAIGAKVACPKKEVVLFVGDGGFQMTNQELAILRKNQLDIKVVLLNNASLGMVRQWQESFFNERHSCSVFDEQPDFVQLAKAYGMPATRLADAAGFEQDFRRVFARSQVIQQPLMLEVCVSTTEHVLPMVPPGKSNDQMMGLQPVN